MDLNLTYLVTTTVSSWHFMNNETFEQLAADEKAIGDNAKWLIDRAECIATPGGRPSYRGYPPNFVELEITSKPIRPER